MTAIRPAGPRSPPSLRRPPILPIVIIPAIATTARRTRGFVQFRACSPAISARIPSMITRVHRRVTTVGGAVNAPHRAPITLVAALHALIPVIRDRIHPGTRAPIHPTRGPIRATRRLLTLPLIRLRLTPTAHRRRRTRRRPQHQAPLRQRAHPSWLHPRPSQAARHLPVASLGNDALAGVFPPHGEGVRVSRQGKVFSRSIPAMRSAMQHAHAPILPRKLQRDNGAQAFLALESDLPAVISHDSLRDHEPKPVPTRFGRVIRLK